MKIDLYVCAKSKFWITSTDQLLHGQSNFHLPKSLAGNATLQIQLFLAFVREMGPLPLTLIDGVWLMLIFEVHPSLYCCKIPYLKILRSKKSFECVKKYLEFENLGLFDGLVTVFGWEPATASLYERVILLFDGFSTSSEVDKRRLWIKIEFW